MNQTNLMKTDIKETENSYILDIEIPGCNKEDIELYIKNNELFVSMNKKKEMKGKILKQECFSGECSRSFNLGNVYNVENYLKAKTDNGVLSITIDKQAYTRPKTFVTIE